MDLADAIRMHLPQARAAWVFGSRVRGDARPDSDLDVAILLDAPPSLSAWMALAERLNRALDLDVNLFDLHRASLDVQAEAITTGRCLFQTDVAVREAYEAHVLSSLAHLNDARVPVREALTAWGRRADLMRT